MSAQNFDERAAEEELNKSKVKETFILNKMTIRPDSQWKGVFDIFMLFITCYNIFASGYRATFGINHDTSIFMIEVFIEFCFLLDMIFCFFEQYNDEESYVLVCEFKKIAKHYLKNNFIFDILAWIPFEYIFPSKKERLWRILKILRMPKLADLLDVEKIK
jgi:hypothetical protein